MSGWRIGNDDDDEIRSCRGFRQFGAGIKRGEAGRFAAAVGNPLDLHVESRAALGQGLADLADADDQGAAPGQQALGPALPFGDLLVLQHARKIAQQREHQENRQFGHLRTMNAAHRGDDQGTGQGQRLDRIGAGGQRLDPAEFRRRLEQRGRHGLGLPDQDVRLTGLGDRLGFAGGGKDGQAGRRQAGAVIGQVVGLLIFGQQQGRHAVKKWLAVLESQILKMSSVIA